MANKIFLYVGTYTRPSPAFGTPKGKGIYSYEFEPETGNLTYLNLVEGIEDPSYLAIDSQQRWLYAISEIYSWQEDTVSAYAIDRTNGNLTYINKQVTPGNIAAYVGVDQADRCVMVTHYGQGKNAAVFPIRADGGLAPVSGAVDYTPADVPRTQLHAHCIVTDPSNRFAYVADVGIDKIMIYQLDAEKGNLTPAVMPSIDTQQGYGPRHLTFHPNGKFLYVIYEYRPAITVYAHDPSSGTLHELQTIPTLPNYSGPYEGAAIHFAPSGKFLYGSIRGQQSISAFAVDGSSGLLTYIENHPLKGQTPRDFAIDPSGTFLLTANQKSDTLELFKIDPQSGKLEDTGHETPCPSPACLKFIQI